MIGSRAIDVVSLLGGDVLSLPSDAAIQRVVACSAVDPESWHCTVNLCLVGTLIAGEVVVDPEATSAPFGVLFMLCVNLLVTRFWLWVGMFV